MLKYKARAKEGNTEIIGRLSPNKQGELCIFVDFEDRDEGKWGYIPIHVDSLRVSTGLFDYSGVEVFEGDTFIPYYITPFGDLCDIDNDESGMIVFERGCFCKTHRLGGDSIPLFKYLEQTTGEYICNYGNKTIYSTKLIGLISNNNNEVKNNTIY